MIVSVNPWTGIELARFELHDRRTVNAALDTAVAAQARWRTTSEATRAELLRNLARILRERQEQYARLITLEMGKPIVEALGEIEKCAWTCEWYAQRASTYLADEIVPTSDADSRVVFEPLGIVLAVMPWNYPLWQFFRFAAPAFAAGNGAILKHAANVPQCALAIEEAVQAAGAPAGLFRALFLDADAVAALIADERIAAVALTGSTRVGSIVAAHAGRALKKQVLELGGSDPYVVLADANIEIAAATAVKARFINAGQSCVNAKRFIVDASVADEFVELLCAGVARLAMGDPLQRDTDIGPMARADLRTELHGQVERTLRAGGQLKLGGAAVEGRGFAYRPTVIDHVTPAMAAFREETFGPLAAVTRVASDDEALRLANQTEFGLAAAVWTRDMERARHWVRAIDAGAVFVNRMVASDPRLPFGGIKKSGYGRELGSHGIREFVNVKTVCFGALHE